MSALRTDALTDLTDEQLAARAQTGAAGCFEELVRRFQGPLLNFVQRRTTATGDADAEDLVQDTFVRAYQNLSRYQPPRRFNTWLYTIAYRLAVSRHRKQRARPTATSASLDHVQSGNPEPHRDLAQRESGRQLWTTAAAVLSQPQLTALWLHYVEEMSMGEIAEVMQRTAVAVRVMLHRARHKLMPHVADTAGRDAARAPLSTVI